MNFGLFRLFCIFIFEYYGCGYGEFSKFDTQSRVEERFRQLFTTSFHQVNNMYNCVLNCSSFEGATYIVYFVSIYKYPWKPLHLFFLTKFPRSDPFVNNKNDIKWFISIGIVNSHMIVFLVQNQEKQRKLNIKLNFGMTRYLNNPLLSYNYSLDNFVFLSFTFVKLTCVV